MPGFILNVHGPMLFLDGFKGRIQAAELSIVYVAMPFYTRPDEWPPMVPRKYRKEVLTAISEFTP